MKPSHLVEALITAVPQNVALHIWGACGVGKSQLVKQVAQHLNREFIDVRAVQLDPVDFRGLPRIKDDRTEWITPNFLPTSGEGILFLDELTSAPPMTQAACYQLVLDRALGDYRLTVLSVMLCTFIVPWVLGLLGHRINAARVRLPARRFKTRDSLCAASERWVRWGSIITRRPWTALLVAGIPLLILAFQARRISPGIPDHNSFPAAAESVQALHTLQGMGRSGIVQSLRVVLELPPQSPPLSPAGWLAVSRLTKRFQSDPRAEEVLSLPTLTGMSETADAVNDVPESIRKSFLRNDGQATLIELLPTATLSPNEQIRWVREVRSSDVAAITGVPGAVLRVGGLSAIDADYDSVVKERLPKVVLGVILGSLLALLIGLRSLFAAVKAILLNLLSVGASFGALVVVFQEGHGSKLFGLDGPTGTVYPIVPILSFAIVFGLSMDYEVFLVARVLEERRRGLSERSAVIEGLARTAGLITSAAAIMIAVFTAFTVGSFLVVQMLGFTLAVAVFIDATVVRMVVGPALLQLAGDWNWWPFGLHGAPATSEKELVP